MPQLCGGVSQTKQVTPEVQALVDQVRPAVEEKIGKSVEEFVAMLFTSQVVAGINYFVKVRIGGGSFVHVRIYKDLKGQVALHGVQEQKTELDGIEYF